MNKSEFILEYYLFLCKFNENGEFEKFEIPPPNVWYREFRSDLKKNWSFKCVWCQKKVSSKDSKFYYSIFYPDMEMDYWVNHKTCSEKCGELMWKDVMQNWIIDRGIQEFFEF